MDSQRKGCPASQDNGCAVTWQRVHQVSTRMLGFVGHRRPLHVAYSCCFVCLYPSFINMKVIHSLLGTGRRPEPRFGLWAGLAASCSGQSSEEPGCTGPLRGDVTTPITAACGWVRRSHTQWKVQRSELRKPAGSMSGQGVRVPPKHARRLLACTRAPSVCRGPGLGAFSEGKSELFCPGPSGERAPSVGNLCLPRSHRLGRNTLKQARGTQNCLGHSLEPPCDGER